MESLEQLGARILKAVPAHQQDAFLDWAISGEPIRSKSEKQGVIQRIKHLFAENLAENKGRLDLFKQDER